MKESVMKAAQDWKTSWLRSLLGTISATVLAATAARAEVLVPFTPGDNLIPHVSVQHVENAGIWTYTYTVTNDGPQNAGLFAVEVGGDPEIIESPYGWSTFGRRATATERTILYWVATDVGTLPANFVWDGNIIPSAYAIMPSGPAKVFSIQSPYPPGPVRLWVQGETKMPQVTDESDVDQLPLDAFTKDFTEDSQQIDIADGGPVPLNTCGATNGTPCDDGYFCNGTDSCAGGACTQHSGDPCPIYDADTNCAASCDELTNSCTQPDPVGSPCDDLNPCSVEQCDGFGACRIEPGDAGVACGAPQGGDCQVERTCTGASIVCPSSSSAPSGTACSDDGNPCTVDQCDASGTCTHTAGNAGALCRAAQGACDVPEACSGTSASCPIDQLTAVGTACRASSGICDPQETCSGSSTTCPADFFAASTATCRSGAGICDVAETCTGTSGVCPGDALLPSTSTCRASAGACDVPETCTGTSESCPVDQFTSVGTVCRASSGICDAQGTCTGSSASCPSEVFASSTVTCRAAAGDCDVAEKCTGTSTTCPADSLLPSTNTCRGSAGVCDVTENCSGTSAACPSDQFAPVSVCRAAESECDRHEFCSGSSATCPIPDTALCLHECPTSPLDVNLYQCDQFQKGTLTLRTETLAKQSLIFRASDAPEISGGDVWDWNDTTHYLFCAYNSESLVSKIAVVPDGECQRKVPNDVLCWTPFSFGRMNYRDRARAPQNGLQIARFNTKRRFKMQVKGHGSELQILLPNLDLTPLARSTDIRFQVIRTAGGVGSQFAKCWDVLLPYPDVNSASRFTAKSHQ